MSNYWEPPLESVPIWSLSDDLLSKIFARLNAKDRFELALVCTRWAGVSRMDWTDITCLDLSPISPENVGPIIQLCPKLESITARDCELNLKAISENLRDGLKSLSLYRVSANAGVTATLQNTPEGLCDTVFRELRCLPRLEELILSHLRIGTIEFNQQATQDTPVFQLPETLTRLQLSTRALRSRGWVQMADAPWCTLECLILEASVGENGGVRYVCLHASLYHLLEALILDASATDYADLVSVCSLMSLFRLRQLRELCVLPLCPCSILATDFVRKLNRLEVVCLDFGDRASRAFEFLALGKFPLWSSHPTLRILILTGSLKSIRENLRDGLKSLSLYRVSANTGVTLTLQNTPEGLSEAVFSELRSMPRLEESILSHLRMRIRTIELNKQAQQNTPAFQLSETLKQLQLSTRAFRSQRRTVERAEAPWGTLECLILDNSVADDGCVLSVCLYESVFRLRQLRELCVLRVCYCSILAADFVRDLERLEVVYLDLGGHAAWAFKWLSLEKFPLWSLHPFLRILMITGDISADASEILIPPRRLYPNCFESDPVPLLHVFIGGSMVQKIRFTPSDAVEIHPITLPMPAFLELPEVAAIFKGSWIAEMIKRGEKSGSRLWDYDARIAQLPILFG